ncbi:glycosyltransferase [Telmatobacter sp. DSM 110680]|uniref:Glycosyltransferase n=1 Tax=Telmatobacter sp. DSM 110680 TaxID=3036704 RepID=A0AAU7DEW7_9BACT
MGPPTPAKVLLLIPHLGGGGAEHVTATLARHLSRLKYEVHLGLVTQSSSEAATAREEFPLAVHIHALGARRVRASAWQTLKLAWQLRPALILSGMAHLNLLVLLLRPLLPRRIRILVRQNGTLAATIEAGNHPRLSKFLFRVAYRRASRIICQTESMADELQSELGIPQERLIVLPNPVDIPGIRTSAIRQIQSASLPVTRLLSVARLAPEKGIDLLLDAFARIKERFPAAGLQVAGIGSCEFALKSQCRLLGMDKYVEFLGHIDSPAQQFPGATIFVLSSLHEGLPNALLEAAAAGLPIVATPASPGITDLLRDKPGVWLARDVSAQALADTLSDALTCVHPGQRFQHTWIDDFDQKVAIKAYENEIDRSLLEMRA